MRKELFTTGEFYHVYNRGVDKRIIFMDERDHERFLMGLYLFNDAKIRDYDMTEFKIRSLASWRDDRECLVELMHLCLMSNHFHLFMRQKVDGGTTAFMHKLSTGYSKYFNKKHERTGRLFEGTFKAKPVEKDDYFSHLGVYIPLNPLDLWRPGWKDSGIPKEHIKEAKDFLVRYPWSSYRDYFGVSLISGLVNKETFFEIFGESASEYQKLIDEYITRGLPSNYEAKLRSYEA